MWTTSQWCEIKLTSWVFGQTSASSSSTRNLDPHSSTCCTFLMSHHWQALIVHQIRLSQMRHVLRQLKSSNLELVPESQHKPRRWSQESNVRKPIPCATLPLSTVNEGTNQRSGVYSPTPDVTSGKKKILDQACRSRIEGEYAEWWPIPS